MPNPYSAGTPEDFEYKVWNEGRLTGGSEHAFLRAFHSISGVHAIQSCIASVFRAPVRVSSIWIDRYPIVIPSAPAKSTPRELADLAVVVRVKGSTGLRQRMFLLQGKVDKKNWEKRGSSPKEIELLEMVPGFELRTSAHKGAASLGTFDLQSDFGVPPYTDIPFWSFLLFAPPSRHASTPVPSHAFTAWPSTPAATKPFFSAIVEQVDACWAGAAYPPFGADVHRSTPCKEWRRLYVMLARHVHGKKPCKLTGGAWTNVAPFNLPRRATSLSTKSGNATLRTTGFPSMIRPTVIQRFESSVRYDQWAAMRDNLDGWGADDDLPGDGDDNGFGMIYIDMVDPNL